MVTINLFPLDKQENCYFGNISKTHTSKGITI